MRLKDIFILGILSLLTFPLVLLGILLALGKARLDLGSTPLAPESRARLQEKIAIHSGLKPGSKDSGLQNKADAGGKPADDREAELDRREAETLAEIERLEGLKKEIDAARDSILAERGRLETLLGKSDSLQEVRIKALAQTFGTMRPDDAAKILVSLDDILVTSVLRKVPEDRTRAKILAAVGKISTPRAAAISRLLGLSSKVPVPLGKESAKDSPAKEKRP